MAVSMEFCPVVQRGERVDHQHGLIGGLPGATTPQIAYTASKGAVLAMTDESAVVHAREKIRVNPLCPAH